MSTFEEIRRDAYSLLVKEQMRAFYAGVIAIVIVLACLLTLLLAGLIWAVRSMPKEAAWLLRHPTTTALLATVVVTAIGAAASYWKQRALKSYAIVEIAFGAAVSFNVLRSGSVFSSGKMFAVGSSVYVAARGFNNLADAYKTRRAH
jgi:hypothetical protein